MKEKILSFLGASMLAASALGQTAAPTAPPVDDANSILKLSDFSFDEKISFFNLGTGNVTEFFQQLNWETPVDGLSTHINLPVYTDGSTGAGMLGVGADWTFVHKPFTFVDSADLTLDLKLPTSSAGFGGDGVNVVLGANTGGEAFVDNLSWGVGGTWEFNSEGDYLPVFGGFVNQDIMNINADLSYQLIHNLDLAVNYNFWYLDNGDSLNTIGPALNWHACPNADINVGVDIPFDEYAGSQLDLIVGFGISVKF